MEGQFAASSVGVKRARCVAAKLRPGRCRAERTICR
jgi:hypothetical protein